MSGETSAHTFLAAFLVIAKTWEPQRTQLIGDG